MENENSQNDYSQDKGNLEIVKKEVNDDAVILDKEHLDVKKNGNVIIGTLNVVREPLRRRHEKHYKESTFHLVADIVLVLIILSLLGVLVWLHFYKVKSDISLEIRSSNQVIVSGQEMDFEISYQHETDKKVTDANLTVVLPDNFVISKVVPENIFNANTNTFNLGDLHSGSNGIVKINGTVWGEVGGQQSISATFNYKNSGDRPVNVLSALRYNVEDSALDMKLDLPDKVYQGINFSGSLEVTNNTNSDLENVDIIFTNNEWNIKENICSSQGETLENGQRILNIKKGESATISFVALGNQEEGSYDFGVKDFISVNGQTLAQGEIEKNIEVDVSNVVANVSVNKTVIKKGEYISGSINYINNEDIEINNVSFEILPASSEYQINNLKSDSEECKLVNGKFTKNNLAPNESGNLSFSANISPLKQKINQSYKFLIKMSYQANGQQLTREIYSDSIKQETQVSVKSGGYYYSAQGDQLGIGPIPPVVDIPTNYWIFWEIDNYGNNLSDFTLSAHLPERVVWNNVKSLLAGEINYAEINKRVVWEVSEINAQGGSYKVGFEIALIPEASDLGQVLDLLENIEYTAYDEFTGTTVSGQLSGIDSNLSTDKFVSGQGKVVNLD